MPWTVSDVEKHRKGLSSEEKKKWVKVANSVYADCLKAGGTDKTCAGKAIRIANSKFEEEEKNNKYSIPISAFNFTDIEAFVKVEESGNVDIIPYSGKVIKGHWYWGDLMIDVHGMVLPYKIYPILEQHDISRKVGFSGKPLNEDNKLTIKSVTFVDTEASKEFQNLSKQGFPYQASISGKPLRVEELGDGISAEVNGQKFVGPGSIWREWIYKETSVCVFGADSNTRAKAFAENKEEEVEIFSLEKNIEKFGHLEKKEVKEIMTLIELKETDLAAYESLRKELEEEVRKQLTLDNTKEKEIESLTSQVKELTESLEKAKKTILSFEKEDIIRQEKERKLSADNIWKDKLEASEIPEHLYEKVKTHISYEQFMKEGVLDMEAFGKAIDVEIADWIQGGISKTVLGKTYVKLDQISSMQEEDKWIEEMKAFAK